MSTRSEVGPRLCRIVKERPGIHFRELERAADLSSAGQLRHHIDRLARDGVLVELRDGGYTRFFVVGEHDHRLRPALARFARPMPRRIASLLLEGPLNRTELRQELGCADSTLGYYLARMVRQGDLTKKRGRNCCQYLLTDPEFVRMVLGKQRPVAAVRRSLNGRPLPRRVRPSIAAARERSRAMRRPMEPTVETEVPWAEA